MPELRELSLLELIPALNPDWKSPYHLADWCELIERSLRGHIRAMCAVPFQHYKTTTTLVGVVWLLIRNPKLKIILLTHSHEKAKAMGKDLRKLWQAAGGTFPKGFNTIDDWQTEEGGGCVVMSAEQSKLGYPCDLLLVDDPLDETEYMNRDVRDTVDRAIALYTARCATHLDSVLIVASRWSKDDPIGRRLDRHAVSWEYICHAGIIDYTLETERAFAPGVLSLEGHKQVQREWQEQDPSLKIWWAQMQNDPQPDALGGFRMPMYGPPPVYGRYVIGVDLAYSDEPHSDYLAIVVLKTWEARAHVLNVLREKRDLEKAVTHLRHSMRMYPGAQMYSYISGPEKSAINYLNDRGIPIQPIMARAPKYNRSQHTRDAWNAGQIVLPEQAPWLAGFVARAQAFTGQEKAGDDDEIDALVSACDGGMFQTGSGAKAFGKPRIGRAG
jgi:predicted phage terminase large subunit-like protein